jgi:hypothetical protein
MVDVMRIAGFGGCGLHNPQISLYRRGLVPLFYREMGFRNTPFALSATANIQLLDFLTGGPNPLHQLAMIQTRFRRKLNQIHSCL